MDIDPNICQICKKSTERIEVEYLIGSNHLSCELSSSPMNDSNLPISN